jgi:cytoskeletal protein CcmA (bactofilin family)
MFGYGMIYLPSENASMEIGDSFDPTGEYLGVSIAAHGGMHHFWGGAKATGDIFVPGNVSIVGSMSIDGDIYVSGGIHVTGDVKVTGGMTATDSIRVAPEGALSCSGPAAVNDMEVHGLAHINGTFVVTGVLEIRNGGKLEIGDSGMIAILRNRDTSAPRLIVDSGGSMDVKGTIDASELVSTQIVNTGGIWAHPYSGKAEIFYDVFVFVNGQDRSQGELARHGDDLRIVPCQNGDITHVDITVDGVLIDPEMYMYDGVSVTVPAPVMDGISGEIDISVTSTEIKEDVAAPRMHASSADPPCALISSTMTVLMLASAILKNKQDRNSP